jgi:hypothetical protein
VLASKGNEVIASDLFNRGYGEPGIDFLSSNREVDNIVTNPPYNAAEGFVQSGLRNAKRKFALLLRLAFLEGGNRYRTIFSVTPPSRIWVFSERITFYPAGAIKKGTGTTAYAWFVWEKGCERSTEVKWFKPGYRSYWQAAESGAKPMLFR